MTLNGQTVTLLPQHTELITASSITQEIASARGYWSATTAAQLATLGFSSAQQRIPALVVPIHDVTGVIALHQIRPDHPRRNAKGKSIRYETPSGMRMVLDVPPSIKSLLGNPTVPLFVTEGARKADAGVSHGLCCVDLLGVWNWRGSNANGGKTVLACWESISLNGRQVYLIFDSDVTTKPEVQAALRRLKAFLESRGATVVVLYLPAAADGNKQGLDDFFFAGGSVETLLTFGEPPPVPAPSDEDDHRPTLDCDVEDLHAITQEAWHLIEEQNHPETLYQRGSLAVRLEDDEEGGAGLVELTESRLRFELARRVRCTKTKRTSFGGSLGREHCKPPLDLCRNMLATPPADMPLPMLRAIVEVPVVSALGTLIQTPGYDPASRLLYQPYDATVTISIPDQPTSSDRAWARSLIDELLADFPFATNADRTNAIACMPLPFVRSLITGPTPLHLFEAPTPGSGKGLLAKAVLYPAVGGQVGAIADARDDDEMRKRITARLLEGRAVTLFDNITRPVDSGVISAALTETRWDDRRLGKTETLSLPIQTIWVMTANNPSLSMEIARRTVRIRLDPQKDRPWLRDGWRHPDLLRWAHQERAALIRAILILAQSWLRAGRPAPTVRPLGSFESWTAVIGGILQWAGYSDFLGNALELYETADSDGAAWRAFTSLWWEAYQDTVIGTKELFAIATDLDGLSLGKSTTERGQRTALGSQLRKRKDQVIGDYCLKAAATKNNAAQWYLKRVLVSSSVEVPPVMPTGTPDEAIEHELFELEDH